MSFSISSFWSSPLDERAALCFDEATKLAERLIENKGFVLFDFEGLYYVEVVVLITGNAYSTLRATPLKELKPRKLDFYAQAIDINSLFSETK